MCTDCLQQAYTCVRWSAYGMFYIYFRCFAQQSSTITSMLIFQYDTYCLRYGLLASQPKLGLVDCNSRWAGDVNNALLLVRASCLLGPGMQALRDAAPLLAGRCYSQAGRLSQCLFWFRFCLAAAEAAPAERVNTAVELAKSSDSSLIPT